MSELGSATLMFNRLGQRRVIATWNIFLRSLGADGYCSPRLYETDARLEESVVPSLPVALFAPKCLLHMCFSKFLQEAQ